MNRTRIARLAVLAAGLAAALGAVATAQPALPGAPEGPAVHRAHATPVTDLADDRKLVGLAHSVFVGHVLAKTGQTDDGFPETQFAVEVREVVKGAVTGTVTVNQHGGFRRGGRELVLTEGDSLLEPGQTYLFVTRDYPEKGWHTLVPAYGNLKVRGAEHAQRLRARFRAAHQWEVPLEASR